MAQTNERSALLAINSARAEGVQEGRKLGHKDALDFLEHKYMGEHRPDRDSPEAKAILTVARELARHLRAVK